MQSALKIRTAGIIGCLLENYDHALFALLAPFMAPLFFIEEDPLTALILTYAMLPLGILTRPLGALFLGWMGDRFGRRHAFSFSLVGIAFVTVGMGFLPTAAQVGQLAPVLLAVMRMLQSFFAASELSGGAIYILEHTPLEKRSFTSSLYDAFSISGILIASGLVTWFSSVGYVEEGWRVLFWIGGIPAVAGIFLRLQTVESKEFTQQREEERQKLFPLLKTHGKVLLAVILTSGFSYTTYYLPFTLMNGFIPLVSNITETAVLEVNTALLVMDMLLLPFFGFLATKIGREKLMLAGALGALVTAVPLFYLLDHATFGLCVFVRMAIVIFGVMFAAPYHAWKLELVEPRYRYTILGLGTGLGAQLIGAPATAASLWLFQKTGWTLAPGLYLMLAAFAALYSLAKVKKTVSYIPN